MPNSKQNTSRYKITYDTTKYNCYSQIYTVLKKQTNAYPNIDITQRIFIFTCIYMYIPVICDELFHKFIHRREQSKFASSRYPLLSLGNDFENI